MLLLLKVKDVYGCTYTEPFNIAYIPLPTVKLTPADTAVCYDQTVTFNLEGQLTQLKSIGWNIPEQGYSVPLKGLTDTKVVVTMIDSNHCVIRDTALVKIKSCATPDKCLLVPTAFTPNSDGKNDKVGPITNGCRVQSLLFRIYNR